MVMVFDNTKVILCGNVVVTACGKVVIRIWANIMVICGKESINKVDAHLKEK